MSESSFLIVVDVSLLFDLKLAKPLIPRRVMMFAKVTVSSDTFWFGKWQWIKTKCHEYWLSYLIL